MCAIYMKAYHTIHDIFLVDQGDVLDLSGMIP